MNRRGVTLIELLMAVVIGAIAMFALVPPFIAEGNFFRKGKRQTEAQRDAQVVLRTIARLARESASYAIDADGTGVTFYADQGGTVCKAYFDGDPVVTGGLDVDYACVGSPSILIDGVRSKVASFTITPVVPNRLVSLHLDVTHRLRTTDPFTEHEVLDTELFLRNGT